MRTGSKFSITKRNLIKKRDQRKIRQHHNHCCVSGTGRDLSPSGDASSCCGNRIDIICFTNLLQLPLSYCDEHNDYAGPTICHTFYGLAPAIVCIDNNEKS